MWKNFHLVQVQGFELMTSWRRVSYYHHKTSAPAHHIFLHRIAPIPICMTYKSFSNTKISWIPLRHVLWFVNSCLCRKQFCNIDPPPKKTHVLMSKHHCSPHTWKRKKWVGVNIDVGVGVCMNVGVSESDETRESKQWEREYHIKSVMKINGDERGREMWVPWSCGNERWLAFKRSWVRILEPDTRWTFVHIKLL